MTQKVLVSGATGFVAAHLVKLLLERGYTVVGSVRTTEKGENLQKSLNSPNFSYEIVKNIGAEHAFDSFVQRHPDATVFIHTASPFNFLEIQDIQRDLLEPAINGTKSVLSAVKSYGPQIKRVVITSSEIAHANLGAPPDPAKVEDEDSWNPVTWEMSLTDPGLAYAGSKTFAEKAAWEFVQKEHPNFVLTTVNPTWVLGPQPFDERSKSTTLNISAEILNSLLKLTPGDKDWKHTVGNGVDVRDLAAAHIAAFEKEEAKNKRLLVSSGSFTDQTMLDILHRDFPKETANVPLGTPGSDVEELKKQTVLENSRTRAILGFPLRPLEETIHDSAKQILMSRS